MRRRVIVIAALVIVAGAFVTVPFVSAQGSANQDPSAEKRGGVFLHGTVAQIGIDELQLELPDGTWTVATDADTVIRLPGAEDAALGDLEVGKPVVVRGRVTAVGVLEATEIGTPRAPQGRQPNMVDSLRQARRLQGTLRGEVTQVGANSFKVQEGEQEVTVAITSDTIFRVPDVENATIDEIQIGQQVVVRMQGESGIAEVVGVVSGQQMRRIDQGQQRLRQVRRVVGMNGIRGEVTAIEGDTLTLSTPRGDATVNVDENTRFRVPGQETASLADIEVGQTLIVMGRPDISVPIDAAMIAVAPDRPPEGPHAQ